jgi:hypothetical protein
MLNVFVMMMVVESKGRVPQPTKLCWGSWDEVPSSPPNIKGRGMVKKLGGHNKKFLIWTFSHTYAHIWNNCW